MQEMRVWPVGQEDSLEKEIATHSNILVWEIPWREEPSGLQSMVWQRVGTDLAINNNKSQRENSQLFAVNL